MGGITEPFKIHLDRDVYRIRLGPQMKSRVAVEGMTRDLYTLIDQNDPPKLVFDFAEVGQVSSAILGVIMSVHLRVRRKNGHVRMCNVPPLVSEVFVLTKLDKILDIDRTLQEALERIG